MATVPEPDLPREIPAPPQEPEIPVPDPGDDPQHAEPIDPRTNFAPETVNLSEEDEDAQSQSVAADAAVLDASPFGLTDSAKVSSGSVEDDVEDLVDHMHSMVRSGRIDMDAFRSERNDDDDAEGVLGPTDA
jgi:outer membrane biosynthesis protein TonB